MDYTSPENWSDIRETDFQVWLNHNFGGQVSEGEMNRARLLFNKHSTSLTKAQKSEFLKGPNALASGASNALAN